MRGSGNRSQGFAWRFRYAAFGNLPIPEEAKEFHRRKLAERARREERQMDYTVAIEDFWAFSKGQLTGKG